MQSRGRRHAQREAAPAFAVRNLVYYRWQTERNGLVEHRALPACVHTAVNAKFPTPAAVDEVVEKVRFHLRPWAARRRVMGNKIGHRVVPQKLKRELERKQQATAARIDGILENVSKTKGGDIKFSDPNTVVHMQGVLDELASRRQ